MTRAKPNQDIAAAKQAFAKQLRALFDETYHGNTTQFVADISEASGKKIAERTVNAWLEGKELPAADMLDAIQSVFEILFDDKGQAFEEAYWKARPQKEVAGANGKIALVDDGPQMKTTPIREALRAALETACDENGNKLTQPKIIKEVKHNKALYYSLRNGGTPASQCAPLCGLIKTPNTLASLSYYCSGKTLPTKNFIYFVDWLTGPEGKYPCNPPLQPSLIQTYDKSLRDAADTLWQAAEQSDDNKLGLMIQSIRLRRGESVDDFANNIALCMDEYPSNNHTAKHYKNSLSHVTISNWETKGALPMGDNKARRTLYREIASLAALGDRGRDQVSRSNTHDPWFTDEKNAALCKAFNKKERLVGQTDCAVIDTPINIHQIQSTGVSMRGNISTSLYGRT